MAFSPKFTVLLLIGILIASRASAEGGGQGPSYTAMVGGGVGQYTMTDLNNFREHGTTYGGFLDILSTFKLSPSYSRDAGKSGKFSITIPLTIDYGLEGGIAVFKNVHDGGALNQGYGRLHVDFFSMLSVGVGAYHADLPPLIPTSSTTAVATPTTVTQRPGWGWLYGGQLSLFPNSRVRPYFDARWMSDPMPGKTLSIGLKFVLDRQGM